MRIWCLEWWGLWLRRRRSRRRSRRGLVSSVLRCLDGCWVSFWEWICLRMIW